MTSLFPPRTTCYLCLITSSCFVTESAAAMFLDYGSRKSERIAKLIMWGELCASVEALDMKTDYDSRRFDAYTHTKHFRSHLSGFQASFNMTMRGKRPTEKRLAIDVMSAREEYCNFEIDCVGFIRGEHCRSDALSRTKHNNAFWGTVIKIKDLILYKSGITAPFLRRKEVLQTSISNVMFVTNEKKNCTSATKWMLNWQFV